MLKHLLLSLIISAMPLRAADSPEVEAKIEALLAKLTLPQKLRLCYGDGVRFNVPVPQIGLPKLLMMPGTRGFGAVWRVQDEATAFPSGLGLAATWDQDLVKKTATAIATESASKGVDVLLAPGINIVRDPLGGRTFEYFTEDPFLNARLTVPYVEGVQQTGIAANLKHFVCNNQETNRGEVSANVSERAMREIYFPAFRAGVVEGKAWSAMTSANRVNGEFVSDSKFLIHDVLKQEWGFDGLVLTDWCDVRSTVKAALAGTDLSMSGRPTNPFAKPLVEAVKKGEVPEAVIDDKVRRLLRLAFRVQRMDGQERKAPAAGLLAHAHVALARKVAAEGMVLLKNDGVLPFDATKIKTIAVFGPNADYIHCVRNRGGGSSTTHCPTHEVTPLQGLRNSLGGKVEILWEPDFCRSSLSEVEVVGKDFLQSPDGKPGLNAEYFNNPNLAGKPALVRNDPEVNFLWDMKSPNEDLIRPDNFSARWTGFLIPPKDGQYTFKVVCDDGARITIDDKVVFPHWVRRGFGERMFSANLKAGQKHKLLIEYRDVDAEAVMKLLWIRPFTEEQLRQQLDQVAAVARKADACVFFGGLNNVIETEGHDRKDMNLTPFQAEMMDAVIAANPNTALVMIHGGPVDMNGWGDRAKAILQTWYGGISAGDAIADILFGAVNPSGKLPITFPNKLADNPAYLAIGHELENIRYSEGIFVGYRWYDQKDITPRYPFGHGLSYTTFAYANATVEQRNDGGKPVVTVSFDLTNTGKRAGAETAQVYVSDPVSSVERPPRELKGFRKVTLQPGETQRIVIALHADAFEFWDEKTKAWKLEPGDFEIQVGTSSRNIQLKKTVNLKP